MPDCPHPDIRFCPLYHASHGIDGVFGFGCVDELSDADGCGVHHGRIDYTGAVVKFSAACPGYAERLAFQEDAEDLSKQRIRNMRAAGIH